MLDSFLDATGGHAAEAGPMDVVDGVPARWVAAPGSTAEVAAVLRAAAGAGLVSVARGAGTKLRWGVPPRRLDLIVDTGRLDRVVEHAAGDLVVIAQAGVRLAALDERVGADRQRLAVDEVVPGTTVGGMLATGLSGPRRLAAGAVRDLVLGVTLVRADGVVAKAGGKVVKNVAGYDLAKLVTGAYGTLGLVTEAAFRLHPVAEASSHVSVRVPDAAAAQAVVLRVLHAQFVPAGLEVDRPAGGPVEVAVLIEGTAAGVAARVAQAVTTLAGTETSRPDWWGRLPGSEPAGSPDAPGPAGGAGGPAGGAVLLKATADLAGLGALLAASEGVALRGSAGVGAYHLAVPADDAPELVRKLRSAAGAWAGTVVVVAAPAGVRAAVDPWGPVGGLELMRRVKDRFDPGALLAPGRFVGGI